MTTGAADQHDYDVVVLGTGTAGLTAALRAAAAGARVGLFERADTVGGTSAWSGGTVWLPNNHHETALGFDDSRDKVLTYLQSLSHGLMEQSLIEAYADTAPEVAAWLEANSAVRFEVLRGMSDYHSEQPGGMREGRSLECLLFPFDELGDWAEKVTVGWQLTGEFCMSESSLGKKAPDGLAPEELARRKIRDERGAGQALVGRLLKSCLDRGVVPHTGCRGVRLLLRDGAVNGVLIEGPDGSFEARARGGVVLATGGFEHDAKLVRSFLRGPMERAVSVPTNTGDALRMSMRVGADLADMREAWWVATIDVDVPGRGRKPWQVNSERTRPHAIMVNDDGVRFTNEAANYNALGNAFHVVDVHHFAYVNHPAWLVVDHHFVSSYGLAGFRPPAPTPDWLVEAPTVADLAAAIAVPADALTRTFERWNAHAVDGVDPDFRRGESHHDRAWGDPRFGYTPQATIGPLDTPPFYATRVRCGALGTKGGPRTDGEARVLDVDGAPIGGLYAAGNAMGSVMGMTYGGHGGFEADSAAAWLATARRAEELGYSTLFTTDHYFGPGSIATESGHRPVDVAPISAMTAAAAATTTLRVGCRVFCVDYHNPVVLAKELATIDLLSDGRLEAGLGAGWVAAEYEGLGIVQDRAGVRIERLKEVVALLRQHWSGEPMDMRGTYVRASGFAGRPVPVQRPNPPVLIGGGAPRVLRAAGELADIVSINFNNAAGKLGANSVASSNQQATAEKIGWIRDGAGDRFSEIELEIAAYFVAIGDDSATAVDAMARRFDVPADTLAVHPHALIGPVDAVCEQLQQRREAYGVSYVNVAQRSMEAFAPVVARLAGT